MKNKLIISGVVLLALMTTFLLCMTIDINKKYENLLAELRELKRNGMDTIFLRPGEKMTVQLGEDNYSLKLLNIIKNEPCINDDPNWPCVWAGEYTVDFMINNVEFSLASEFSNYSAQIISTDFITNYVIYYVPEYNEREAVFFIKEEKTYNKENHLIIGNYLVYVDENNLVVDINNFKNEVQTWGKEYAGRSLGEITNLINSGEKLEKG